jgi:hypothetical protein
MPIVKYAFWIHVLILSACVGAPVIDPSADAFNSGDFTLVHSACQASPGLGFDICRVTEGATIDSFWTLIIPHGPATEGGEVDVYLRDQKKTYPIKINDTAIIIPWTDFFPTGIWDLSMSSEAMALVILKWKDPTGIDGVTKLRGLAKIVVTKKDYAELPIDSGFSTWKESCEVQYSSAGRGALKCH